MAISFPSLATAKATIAGYFQTQLSGWDLSSKGAFGKVKAALTLAVYSFLSTARQIDRDAVPTSATSSDGIDEWAANGTGISNGDGGYGRKVAVAATGGVATFTGVNGTIYPINSTLTASDGVTKFILLAAVTVPIGGSISGNVNATTKGTAGNLDAGSVLSIDSVPVGGTNTATLTTATAGGLDQESNSDALDRIQTRIRVPPKGGVDNDYKTWAEDEAGVSGITAGVYPLRAGTGTVDVVVWYTAASGQARRVGTTDLATINAYIGTATTTGVRPVTVEHATVYAPYMPNGAGLAILVRPTESKPANAFDFDSSTGGPFTVAAYNAAAKTLTLNANSPGLDTAVNTNLQTPRIQVITTGVTLPQEGIVTAYNNGTFVATLSAALATTPTVGDAVYSGGPMVQPIAAAILAHVDSLGPSRSSGYADPDTAWLDALRIDQLIKVVLSAVDDGGEVVAIDLATDPTINGVASNVTASDTAPGVGPGMLYASSIAVTP